MKSKMKPVYSIRINGPGLITTLTFIALQPAVKLPPQDGEKPKIPGEPDSPILLGLRLKRLFVPSEIIVPSQSGVRQKIPLNQVHFIHVQLLPFLPPWREILLKIACRLLIQDGKPLRVNSLLLRPLFYLHIQPELLLVLPPLRYMVRG